MTEFLIALIVFGIPVAIVWYALLPRNSIEAVDKHNHMIRVDKQIAKDIQKYL